MTVLVHLFLANLLSFFVEVLCLVLVLLCSATCSLVQTNNM